MTFLGWFYPHEFICKHFYEHLFEHKDEHSDYIKHRVHMGHQDQNGGKVGRMSLFF